MQSFLDIFNSMLSLRGEEYVSAEEASRHPLYKVAETHVRDSLRTLLSRGWWFNTTIIELQPDHRGYITLPEQALVARPFPENADLAFMGRVLTCTATGEPVTVATKARCFVEVDLFDLPAMAYQAVKEDAVLRCCGEFITGNDRAAIMQRMAEAKVRLNAEDIMQRRRNIEDSNRYIRQIRSRIRDYRRW